MKSSWWAAGLTYVGAVVGAGFASGQEIYQFFGRFGERGLVGIALAGLLFGIFGYLALEAGRRSGIQTFGNLLAAVYPPWLVRIAEGVTIAFLVVGLGVVSSGGGAAIHQLVGGPLLLGAAVTTAAVVTVTAFGTRSVVRVNTLLVPYLVLMVVVVAALNWTRPRILAVTPVGGGEWLLSALLYLSYNIFTGIVILLGVGGTLRSRRHSATAAFFGAAVLSILAVVEHHALVRLDPIGPLPLVDAAARAHQLLGGLFGLCLWVALFTTGVAEAYALREQYGKRVQWLLLATFLFGLFGFGQLVQVLYPIMGMVAVLLWIPLVYRGPHRGIPGG